MIGYTMEDLKATANFYDSLIERADKIVALKRMLNNSHHDVVDIRGIDEFEENGISFVCEDSCGHLDYKTLTYEELLDADYVDNMTALLEEKEEAQRWKREREKQEKLKVTEEQERKELARLLQKFRYGVEEQWKLL